MGSSVCGPGNRRTTAANPSYPRTRRQWHQKQIGPVNRHTHTLTYRDNKISTRTAFGSGLLISRWWSWKLEKERKEKTEKVAAAAKTTALGGGRWRINHANDWNTTVRAEEEKEGKKIEKEKEKTKRRRKR